jgi:integrase
MAKLSPAELKGLRLSDAMVSILKKPGDYLDGVGLVLQVRSATSKSWLLKYQIANRPREMGLGSWKKIPLQLARELRKDHQQLIAQGIDPLELKVAKKHAAKVEAAKQITFRLAAERLIASKRKGWKNQKHASQWAATLETYAYPLIGDLPVQAVTTGMVMRILDPLWATKTETASRVRGRIEAVINAAKAYGEYIGENPARWKGNLDATLAKTSDVATVKNQSALFYAELPAFLIDLHARAGIASAALEFQILTASRPGNALGARWNEIDHGAAVWTIAGENMKGGKAHKVPLSAAALAVLARMKKIRTGEFVFFAGDGDKSLSDAATGALLDRMNAARKRADLAQWSDPQTGKAVVPHGFRSTFRTWAGDKTNFQREVVEKALAHLVGDETERAYDRGDLFEKRKALMDAWAAFATREHSADVLAFAPLATAN